jgi:hypothetical protein
VSPRPAGRKQACNSKHALVRLNHARAFLEVAELVGTQKDELATPSVAAALAVLAGIAASDAACCAALGQRPRGQDHRQAVQLLERVDSVGPAMAQDLGRLLSVKDDSHYGLLHVSSQRATAALRLARRLVATADQSTRRLGVGGDPTG